MKVIHVVTGPLGPRGDLGLTGPSGSTGPQGPQGEIGPQGPQGEIGPIGSQGITGEVGPVGATGPQGDTGPQGATGPQGDTGPSGLGLTFIDSENLKVTASLQLTGSLRVTNGITGSLLGTSSFALTASYALNVPAIETGSFVISSSFNEFTSSIQSQVTNLIIATASYITTDTTGSMSVLTSSFALTASYALNIPEIDTSALIGTASFNEYTQSVNDNILNLTNATSSYITTGDINSYLTPYVLTSQTSSMYVYSASNASTADFVTITPGDGILVSGMTVTSKLRTVNGNTPDPVTGNVSVSLTAVLTGPSSSLIVSSSGDNTGSITNGTIWIVSDDLPANNGDSYVFKSGSVGQWFPIAPLDQTAADIRYARVNIPETQLLTSSFAVTATTATSASYATTASFASSATIQYVTNSIQSLRGIEVADFSETTAVTFIDGVLKFIFGTPAVPTTPSLTLPSFTTDRFNRQSVTYSPVGTFNQNGYTLISADLYTGSVLLQTITTGTGATFSSLTTSGSQYYTLAVTASSPLNGTIVRNSFTTTTQGLVTKTNPAGPTVAFSSALIQLGLATAGSTLNAVEQGATGSLTATITVGTANNWTINNFKATASYSGSSNIIPIFSNVNGAQNISTFFITGSVTGSGNIVFGVTSSYDSGPLTNNNPVITATGLSANASSTINKIRSVRHGVSTKTSFTLAELENLALWDTTLGGTVGVISKGTTDPRDYQATLTTAAQYFYFVIDSSYTLNGILNTGNSNANDLAGAFSVATVGNYKVYKSNNISSTTITYKLTRP